MCYRCEICQAITEHGQVRQLHHVLRPDGNIHTELSVCRLCKFKLRQGANLQQMVEEARIFSGQDPKCQPKQLPKSPQQAPKPTVIQTPIRPVKSANSRAPRVPAVKRSAR